MLTKKTMTHSAKKTRNFIELSYNGTNYHGWQIQPNAITIQEELNKALSTILREEIQVIGAGRTDTGVHASYFIAHFETNQGFDNEKLTFKLNRFLSNEIFIHSIKKVHSEAHSRFDALSRTYHYFISRKKDPFRKETSWRIDYSLDIDLMNEAAKILFEYTDFTSFSKLHTDTKTNLCDMYHAQWYEKEHLLILKIEANRFLRNMVRAIVGTLVWVGNKKISVDDFRQIIETKNRGKAGCSAPPQGLFLTGIKYPENLWKPVYPNLLQL